MALNVGCQYGRANRYGLALLTAWVVLVTAFMWRLNTRVDASDLAAGDLRDTVTRIDERQKVVLSTLLKMEISQDELLRNQRTAVP